jgi:hypothetical protein
MDALAAQITTQLSTITNLQVDGRLVSNPTPPCIDMYPGDPFMQRSSYGEGWDYFFSVRCRVSTADQEAGQDLLLSLMDPTASTSLTSAIESDATLGGTVDDLQVEESPSSFGIFSDPGAIENRLLGAIWRVHVIPT